MFSCRCRLFLCCLLLCFFPGDVSAESINAAVGSDVTLTCNYDVEYYGRLAMCWGRGAIPNRGCSNQVIHSDGTSMSSRASERYLLMGDLLKGDVSLTIRQVQESDSGMYGCRVDIPGWFNDHKHQITLSVVPVRPQPLKLEIREVKERTLTVHWTLVFDGGRPITSYKLYLKNKLDSWDAAVITEVVNLALTHITVVDLRPAKTYNLRMFAVNSVGISEGSNVLTVITKEAVPEGPPLDVQLQALSSHSIQVSWKPPRADLRNGVLRSYTLSYREYDPAGRHFKKWQHQSVPAIRETENIILNNLRSSTKYSVHIQAKTNAGVGPASTALLCSTLDEVFTTLVTDLAPITSTAMPHETSSFTTVLAPSSLSSSSSSSSSSSESSESTPPITTVFAESTTIFIPAVPDPPVLELIEISDNTVSLCWIAGYDGGSPVTGYNLEYKSVNASWDYTKTVVDFSSNETEATIIEIHPSTYNIRMFAQNKLGMSDASNILTVTIGEAGHWRITLTTTLSTDHQAAVSVEESQSGRLAAIVVPVVLVVLIIAMVITWQLHRIKRRKGSLDMWLTSGKIRYQASESLQEL